MPTYDEPSQWEIYDAYVEELLKTEKDKDKPKQPVTSTKDGDKSKRMMQMETQVPCPLIRIPVLFVCLFV